MMLHQIALALDKSMLQADKSKTQKQVESRLQVELPSSPLKQQVVADGSTAICVLASITADASVVAEDIRVAVEVAERTIQVLLNARRQSLSLLDTVRQRQAAVAKMSAAAGLNVALQLRDDAIEALAGTIKEASVRLGAVAFAFRASSLREIAAYKMKATLRELQIQGSAATSRTNDVSTADGDLSAVEAAQLEESQIDSCTTDLWRKDVAGPKASSGAWQKKVADEGQQRQRQQQQQPSAFSSVAMPTTLVRSLSKGNWRPRKAQTTLISSEPARPEKAMSTALRRTANEVATNTNSDATEHQRLKNAMARGSASTIGSASLRNLASWDTQTMGPAAPEVRAVARPI